MNHYLISWESKVNTCGHVVISSNYFPSYKKIKETLIKMGFYINDSVSLVITNVYKFDSHLDAENFRTGKYDNP
jgi:hypothetical protein